jgi:hypothetical protein
MKRIIIFRLIALTACSMLAASLAIAQAQGGSNYGWYQINGCDREPYGVIYNYDTQSQVINSQLQQMYNNGQRRLRIPIYHGHGLNTGTVMDSTGGNLSPQFRTNLANLLVEIRSIGYVEVEVGFFPIGATDPTQWDRNGAGYSEDSYQENWNVVYNLHSIIANAGFPVYRIDLINEGIPTSAQPALLQYTQHLWNDYVSVFGKNDTVGASVIVDADRISQMPVVYGNSRYGNHGSPYLFDIHLYDGSNPSQLFMTAYNSLNLAGYAGVGWIIGEAFYNDAVEAQGLQSAIQSTGQTVFYLTQWPLQSSTACQLVSIAGVLDFTNYRSYGF